MEKVGEPQLYYDPFAPDGEQFFDAAASFRQITERYQNREIEHDYSADRYVADSEALMLDAQFVGQFEAAQNIALQMHALCGTGGAHELQVNIQSSAMFGEDEHGHSRHMHERSERTENTTEDKKKREKGKRVKKGKRKQNREQKQAKARPSLGRSVLALAANLGSS